MRTGNSTSTLAVEIHDDRINLGVLKIRGRKATISRTVSEALVYGEDPCAKIIAIAKSLGVSKARLFVAASPEGAEHRMLTLPPMNAMAMRRFVSAKLAADLQIPVKELSWAVANPSGIKSSGPRQTMAVAVREKSIDQWRSLEEKGFPVEMLTTPEMALHAIGRELAGPGDAIYIYPSEEATMLVAASPAGPVFIRIVSAGQRSAGLNHLLQEELRYTTIYLQQHLKKTVNCICIIGNEEIFEKVLPAAGAASGVEVVRLGIESLVSCDSAGLFLGAALAVVKDRKCVPDLLSRETVIRRGLRLAAVSLALAAALFITFNVKQSLDIGIQKGRLAREAYDIEQTLPPLRKMTEQKKESVEKQATRTLEGMEEMQFPPWPEVLREISLATPEEIHFDSMTITRGGIHHNRSGRGAERRKGSGVTASGGEGWVLTIQGSIAGEEYPLLQKNFRRWYETLLTSPYLKKVDIGNINLLVRQEAGRVDADDTGKMPSGEMRFTITAKVQTKKGVEDVLNALGKRVAS